MKYIFETEVRGYELDSYGHLNNAVYMNYTEQARWDILKTHGISGEFFNKGLLLVVTETNIRYMREMKLFDKVKIETSVEHRKPYLVFYHQVYNETTMLKSAKAVVKTLLIDRERLAQDIPGELLAIL